MDYYKERSGLAVVAKLLLLVGAGFGFGWHLAPGAEVNSEAQEVQNVSMERFWEVWSTLHDKHVEAANFISEDLVYGAIKGMVAASGDDYTVYMDPEEAKDFYDSLNSTLDGIGAELEVIEGRLTVVSPLPDSPAERAGLMPEDFIYKIDGEFTEKMDLYEAIKMIRGPKGSTVTLTLVREGVDGPFDVSIVRDKIEIETVSSEMLAGDILYIELNQFDEKETAEALAAVLKGVALDQPKGVILDLRFNGGGYLEASVDVLSYFVPSGTKLVSLKGKHLNEAKMAHEVEFPLLTTPLVVLVNGGSASASEIVAGAVQDLKRGVVMGEQSFGKGSVQELVRFDDESLMRVTTDKWYTPNDRNIHGEGITPDVVVELTEEDYEKEFDRQKEEARKYLEELKN